jgi:hypothetical protein
VRAVMPFSSSRAAAHDPDRSISPGGFAPVHETGADWRHVNRREN